MDYGAEILVDLLQENQRLPHINEYRRSGAKAIIPTGRKLLKSICDTLKNGWVFEDPAFKIAQKQNLAGQSS